MAGRCRRRRKRIRKYPVHSLKALIKVNGVKQKQIALITGISLSKLSRYLNGWKFLPSWIESDILKAIIFLDEDTPEDVRCKIFDYFFPDPDSSNSSTLEGRNPFNILNTTDFRNRD